MSYYQNLSDYVSGVMPRAGGMSPAQNESRYLSLPPGVSYCRQPIDDTIQFNYDMVVQWARYLEDSNEAVYPAMQCLIDNVIDSGFVPSPNTGDPGLDTELSNRWSDWSSDPRQVDFEGTRDFASMEEMVMRAVIRDGDVFALPLNTGQIQLLEGELCRNPGNITNTERRRTFMGVEKTDNCPTAYYLAGHPYHGVPTRYDAVDSMGYPNVLHVMFNRRCGQTRGLSSLSITRDMAAFLSDINFATLVKAKLGALWCLIEKDMQGATGVADPRADVGDLSSYKVKPGALLSVPRGRDLSMFTSNVPNQSQFEHFVQTLKFICACLRVPINFALLDASSANFSALRMVFSQSKKCFRPYQKKLSHRFHVPIWKWRCRWLQWTCPEFQKYDLNELSRCDWNFPTWEYLDPLSDSKSDSERLGNFTASLNMISKERYGYGARRIIEEKIGEARLVIEQCIEVEKAFKSSGYEDIDWREVLRVATFGNLSAPTAPVVPDSNETADSNKADEPKDGNDDQSSDKKDKKGEKKE